MSLSQFARARSRLLTRGVVATLALAGIAVAGTGVAEATVVPPTGSPIGIMLESGANPEGGFSGDPANALSSGWWGHEGGANDGTGTNATFLSLDASEAGTVSTATLADTIAKLGATNINQISYAIVPYSADGSTETPTIGTGKDATDASKVFNWLVDDTKPSTGLNGTSGANDSVTTVSTYTQFTSWVNAGEQPQAYNNNLQLVDISNPGTPSATPKGTSILNTWPAGTQLSLVAYLTNGMDANYDNKIPLVAVGPDGKARTAWMNFTTVGKTGDALRTSAGYVVSGAYAPTISLSSSFSGSTATLTGTIKNRAGTTATDATGTLQFAEVVGGVPQPPTSVAVTNGVASTQFQVPSGGVKQYAVTYVPDDAASVTYSQSATVRKTITAPTATSTSLKVVGGTTDTMTATVSPAAAPGRVTFKDGATTLSTVTVSGGHATYKKNLAIGKHALTATFVPTSTATYVGSVGSKTVFRAKIAVTLSPTKARHGKRPKVTIKVTAPGATVSGTVTITWQPPRGGAKKFTVTLHGGTATYLLPKTIKGTSKVTVMYNGNSQIVASPSGTVTFRAT